MVSGMIARVLCEGLSKAETRAMLKDFSKHSGVSVVSIQKVMNGV